MSCCVSCVDIGCVNGCEAIDLGYNAVLTGDHTASIYVSNGVYHQFTIAGVAGEALTIPANTINETGVKEMTIKQPNGTLYAFASGVTCLRLTNTYSS